MTTNPNTSKNVIITVLAIALVLVTGYCIYLQTKSQASLVGPVSNPQDQGSFSNFKHPVTDEDAMTDIQAYRTGNKNGDPNIIIYEDSDIEKYLSCVWPQLTKATPPANYHWAVGFYFVKKMDTTTKASRLDFYVTPTLVQSTTDVAHPPLDFLNNAGNTTYYQHDPKLPCTSTTTQGTAKPLTDHDSGNSFDAGQLWP